MSAVKLKGKYDNSFLKSDLDCLSKPYRVQSAAVLSVKDVSVEQMYVLSNRAETNWGVEGYDPEKKYLDPVQQVKDRAFLEQKKGQKNIGYVTKRGNYLDDLKKITDEVPAANKYDTTCKWPDPKENSKKPQSAPPKRQTFIDTIYHEQKVRGIPGAGKYNLEKPLKDKLAEIEEQKKTKLFYPERPNYLQEHEHLGVFNPGAGMYNPRVSNNYDYQQIQQKLKVNNTGPKDFIKKHNEENKKRGKSAHPDMGTYQPQSVEYKSFGKMMMLQKDDKKDKIVQKNCWGLEVRFKNPKKTKSRQTILTPGPGSYPMLAHWPGKEDGMKKDKSVKSKNWLEGITKGPQISIYY